MNGVSGNFLFGDVNTAATTIAAVRRTTYNEPAAQAQRSVSSSSALDTLAGTGAQKVMITYYDSTGAGPFTETLNMNGTTAVNTVGTNIRFIEKIEVVQVGSTGSNAGTITLFVGLAGAGGVIGTIGATDNQTFWAHHYVPTGKVTNVTSLSVSNSGTGGGNSDPATFILKALAIGVTGAVEAQISDFAHVAGSASANNFVRPFSTPVGITGPARITAYVTPDGNQSAIQRASFDFFDQ